VSCRSLLPIHSLSLSLGISIGKGKGRVPWAKLKRAQNDYIEEKYLPKNVSLEQYYHLRQDDVNTMLKHWTERQAAGEVPFQFKKKVKAARKNKRTPEENDADADTESGKEAGEDLQSSDESQERGNGEFRGEGGSNSSNEHPLPGRGLGNAAENPSRVGWFLKYSDSRH
jgi:ATP-dependent helicase YprA (DUF1998 family)